MAANRFIALDDIRERWFDHKGSLKEEAVKRNIEEAWHFRDIHDLLTECERLQKLLKEEWAESSRRIQQDVLLRAEEALAKDIAMELRIRVVNAAKKGKKR